MRVRPGSAGHRDRACYDALIAGIATTRHQVVARGIACSWCQDQVSDAKSTPRTGFVREGGFEPGATHARHACIGQFEREMSSR
jgi:hypothetical protein